MEPRKHAFTCGIVVIGRDEGERLRRCLDALAGCDLPVVYADCGSTDGSAAWARRRGIAVVDVDASRPFTAARARNAGCDHLLATWPGLDFIQFIDGDCELLSGWLETAIAVLLVHPQVAVVCGRRRERRRDSVYQRLADMEWDTPLGDTDSCGGDALVRVCVLQAAGGFDGALSAGEEPELCLRLRRAGHRIVRVDSDMTAHDLGTFGARQWWRRSARTGHAYAGLVAKHGMQVEADWPRQLVSLLIWGAALPIVSLGAAWLTGGGSLLLLVAYAPLWTRVYLWRRRWGTAAHDAALYATACLAAKFPGAAGVFAYAWDRMRGTDAIAVIYPSATAGAPPTPRATS